MSINKTILGAATSLVLAGTPALANDSGPCKDSDMPEVTFTDIERDFYSIDNLDKPAGNSSPEELTAQTSATAEKLAEVCQLEPGEQYDILNPASSQFQEFDFLNKGLVNIMRHVHFLVEKDLDLDNINSISSRVAELKGNPSEDIADYEERLFLMAETAYLHNLYLVANALSLGEEIPEHSWNVVVQHTIGCTPELNLRELSYSAMTSVMEARLNAINSDDDNNNITRIILETIRVYIPGYAVGSTPSYLQNQ